MSEQMWWTRNSEGEEHPDDAVLLAFVRGNLGGEDAQEVYRHLGECTRCQDYCRVGRLLYRMQPAYEARASVADEVFAYINNPVRGWLKKQRKRLRHLPGDVEFGLAFVVYQITRHIPLFKSKEAGTAHRLPGRSIKKVSLAWVFALLLTAFVAALLLAPPLLNIHAKPKATVPHTKSPNIPSPPTPTPRPTPTPKPTPRLQPLAAAIQLCDTSANRFQERVGICGSHFHPGDKLELWFYVAGGQPRAYRALVVNAQGQFQTFLVVTQCRETIKAIYVADITNSSVNPAPLTNIQVGRCEVSPGG